MLYVFFFVLFITVIPIKIEHVLFEFILLLLAYVTIGIGGFLLNDFTDVESDKIADKKNISNLLKPKKILASIMLLWLIGLFIAWRLSPSILGLSILQLILLVIYATKPIRIKERGVWGIFLDAIYAHVLPEIILLAFINKYTNEVFIPVSFLLISFSIGIRDIVAHQLQDYSNDLKSNTKTFAVENYNSAIRLVNIFRYFVAILIPLFWLELHHKCNQELFICLIFIYIIVISIIYSRNKKLLSHGINDTFLRLFIILSGSYLIITSLTNQTYFQIIFIAHPYLLGFFRTYIQYSYLKVIYVIKVIFGKLFITIIPLFINKILYIVFKTFGRDLKTKPLYNSKNEFNCIKKFKQFWNN